MSCVPKTCAAVAVHSDGPWGQGHPWDTDPALHMHEDVQRAESRIRICTQGHIEVRTRGGTRRQEGGGRTESGPPEDTGMPTGAGLGEQVPGTGNRSSTGRKRAEPQRERQMSSWIQLCPKSPGSFSCTSQYIAPFGA